MKKFNVNNKEVKQKIQDHIIDHIEHLDYEGIGKQDIRGKLKHQLDAMKENNQWYDNYYTTGRRLVEGGAFEVSNYEIEKFLDSLNLRNQSYKEEGKTFEFYVYLVTDNIVDNIQRPQQ